MAGNQVLATAEANKALIRLDPLQKLHTLSNLADLLKGGSMPGVPRTLRDDSLQADADKIREVRHCLGCRATVLSCVAPCILDCCEFKRQAAYACAVRHALPR